jgi:ubiquitin-conjugating enzyme E2 variant
MAEFRGEAGEAVAPVFAAQSDGVARRYGYTRSHRILEIAGLAFGSGLLALTGLLTARAMPEGTFGLVLASGLTGMALSDLISGFVHWAADSYGTNTMPIFGGFVRTFREHHTDQLDITRHDAIETNGDVFVFSSPVHFVLLFLVHSPWALALVFGVFLGSYSNSQIHKWAHEANPPRFVRALQRSRFFLSPEHHARHHAGTHESHYCITTGWMNLALDRLRFFRVLEIVLARLGIRRSA